MRKKGFEGFKFFQFHLNRFKLEHYEASCLKDYQPLKASNIAVFIIYHSICDEYGRILESDHSIRKLADKYNLQASTLCIAHHDLIKRGFIREVTIENQRFFEIVNYAELNTSSSEGKKDENLNYFKIPYKFLYTLHEYIRARDVDGLIYALTLINSLYREYSTNSRSHNISIKRYLDTIINNARKTKRNIHSFLFRLRTIFNLEKQNSEDSKKTLFLISFISSCFKDIKEDPTYLQLQMKLKKDIVSRFSNSQLKYNRKDIRDVFYTLKSELLSIIQTFYANKVKIGNILERLLINSYTEAMDKLVEEVKHVKNIGAYFRTLLRNAMFNFLLTVPGEEFVTFLGCINAWGLKFNVNKDLLLYRRRQEGFLI